MKKKKRVVHHWYNGAQCHICRVVDPETPPFAVYAICTRCLGLTPLAVFRLPPDQKKRAAVAFLANHYFPELADNLEGFVEKHLPALSPTRKGR